jgi:eukaryotic-like serine/threonine-protein kinase
MFPQIFGKYVLERELASGGMARVFLATLRGAGGFEKRLCVKQIRPELASDQCFIQRFVAEAKTTVDLSHANIVPVYELGAEQGTFYIAMEFCAGVSLAELLRAGRASPSEGAYIGVEICRALDYAHRKAGVVHRDVTPRNVMIDPEGMVRVIDFGIAAPASATASGGLAFGSPGHMPPEQLRAGPLTPAADVFAVAVLLIETWTGRAPFRRESFQASLSALADPPPPLGDTDPALAPLEPLIEAALAHAANERPQSAEELARPLREFLRRDDLGDIARRLGQRVTERLLELENQAQSDSADSFVRVAASSVASAPMASGTATFAAREVLREWTAKIESVAPAPAPAVPSTRSERDRPELESGMTASSPSRSSERTRGRRLRVLASGLGLGSSALLALALMAERQPLAPVSTPRPTAALAPASNPSRDPSLEPSSATAVLASASSTQTRAESPLVVPPRLAAPLRKPTPSAPVSDNSASSSPAGPPKKLRAATSSAVPAQSPLARLQLTAEPAAWVEVDASRIGHTPLMGHGSSPGRHTITFVSQLLGEKLETTVTLEPDAFTHIHADFTSANPRVIVR